MAQFESPGVCSQSDQAAAQEPAENMADLLNTLFYFCMLQLNELLRRCGNKGLFVTVEVSSTESVFDISRCGRTADGV